MRSTRLIALGLGLALALGVATQLTGVSAQGSGIVGFCRQLVADDVVFETVGECVGTIETLENPGKAEGVGLCKSFFAASDIPKRFMGECVRQFRVGRAARLRR